MVQLFTGRAELLDEGETTAEHSRCQREEAQKLDNDKSEARSGTGGLFHGIFKEKARLPPARPLIDVEDGVLRCPHCSWELEDEDAGCERCGFLPEDSMDEDGQSFGGWSDDDEDNSDMTDYLDDELEDGFGEVDDDVEFDAFYARVHLDGHLNGLSFGGPRRNNDARHRHHQHPPPPPPVVLADDSASSRDGAPSVIDETASSLDGTPSAVCESGDEVDDDEMRSFVVDDSEEGEQAGERRGGYDSLDDDGDDDEEGEVEHAPEQGGDSLSDQSTVVGGPGYTIRDLYDDVQDSSSEESSYHDPRERDVSDNAEGEDSDSDEYENPYEPQTRNQGNGWRSSGGSASRALGLLEEFDLESLNQFSRNRQNNRSSARVVDSTPDASPEPVRPRGTRGRV